MSSYSSPSDFRIKAEDAARPYVETPSLHPLSDRGEFDTSFYTSAYTGLPINWRVTEKVAGVSCRILFKPHWYSFALGGRTLQSQLHPTAAAALYTHLKTKGNPCDVLKKLLTTLQWPENTKERALVVCGEAYGPGLGPTHNYGLTSVRFAVTSVFVQGPLWYADDDAVTTIALALGFAPAPVLAESATTDEALALLDGPSLLTPAGVTQPRDGVIAFANPFLADRYGNPVCWKARSCNLTPLPV